AKVIQTPAKYLIPIISALSIFGVYAVQAQIFDLVLLLICGIAGFLLARNDFPLAPLVLGLVLGPMIENNMRRALTTSNGDFMIFLQKPMSLAFLIIALLWIVVPILLKRRGKEVVVNEEG
ncbi:tripartite tricarboxylate transporter permease, partial [Clostridium perfringens]